MHCDSISMLYYTQSNFQTMDPMKTSQWSSCHHIPERGQWVGNTDPCYDKEGSFWKYLSQMGWGYEGFCYRGYGFRATNWACIYEEIVDVFHFQFFQNYAVIFLTYRIFKALRMAQGGLTQDCGQAFQDTFPAHEHPIPR